MIRLTRDLLTRWLDALLHVNDTPERTAAAYALGVFLGFSPMLGLHTVLAIVLAFFLNLNRVAVLLGVYSNLPWIMGGYYASTTVGVAMVMRVAVPTDLQAQLAALMALPFTTRAFWDGLGTLLRPLLVPYTIGSGLGAVVLAAIAYPAALAFVRRQRQFMEAHHHQHTGAGMPAPQEHEADAGAD